METGRIPRRGRDRVRRRAASRAQNRHFHDPCRNRNRHLSNGQTHLTFAHCRRSNVHLIRLIWDRRSKEISSKKRELKGSHGARGVDIDAGSLSVPVQNPQRIHPRRNKPISTPVPVEGQHNLPHDFGQVLREGVGLVPCRVREGDSAMRDTNANRTKLLRFNSTSQVSQL